MIEQRSGNIINISSDASLKRSSRSHTPIDAGCKGFINSLTKVLAYDLGEYGRPIDVAACAYYVASDAAAHVTGQLLSISGGHL